jgi:nitroreductase
MELMEVIKSRRSIRKYRPDPIEPEKLTMIAEAFRLAPSARNGQSWKLLIVSDPAKKELLREASPSKHSMITEAPVVLVGICDNQRVMTNGHRSDSVDVSIAMTFAMLEAHALGLGTCWMANYTEPEIKSALGLGDKISVVAIMPLGYADESPDVRPRKPTKEVVEYI